VVNRVGKLEVGKLKVESGKLKVGKLNVGNYRPQTIKFIETESFALKKHSFN